MNRRDVLRLFGAAVAGALVGPPLLTTGGGPAPLTSRLRARMRETLALYFVEAQMNGAALLPVCADLDLFFGVRPRHRDDLWAYIKSVSVPLYRWKPGMPVVNVAAVKRYVAERIDAAMANQSSGYLGRGFLDLIETKARTA